MNLHACTTSVPSMHPHASHGLAKPGGSLHRAVGACGDESAYMLTLWPKWPAEGPKRGAAQTLQPKWPVADLAYTAQQLPCNYRGPHRENRQLTTNCKQHAAPTLEGPAVASHSSSKYVDVLVHGSTGEWPTAPTRSGSSSSFQEDVQCSPPRARFVPARQLPRPTLGELQLGRAGSGKQYLSPAVPLATPRASHEHLPSQGSRRQCLQLPRLQAVSTSLPNLLQNLLLQDQRCLTI
jgi:hypothetical protein